MLLFPYLKYNFHKSSYEYNSSSEYKSSCWTIKLTNNLSWWALEFQMARFPKFYYLCVLEWIAASKIHFFIPIRDGRGKKAPVFLL